MLAGSFSTRMSVRDIYLHFSLRNMATRFFCSQSKFSVTSLVFSPLSLLLVLFYPLVISFGFFCHFHPVAPHVPCGRTFRYPIMPLCQNPRETPKTQFGLCLSDWVLTRCGACQISLVVLVCTRLLWWTTSPLAFTLYLEYLQLEAN